MALKWPIMCWCAVKKLLTHSAKIVIRYFVNRAPELFQYEVSKGISSETICPRIRFGHFRWPCGHADLWIRLPARGLLHRDAEKMNQFSFVCSIFNTWQKLVIFFTYIRPKESRSISYNSVYLILACVKNFAATVTVNILCLPVE